MEILTAEEKESLAQEFIQAAKMLCIASQNVQKLLYCDNFEKTPETKKEMEAMLNFPEIEDINISLRSLAMRLDRAALIKSME